LNIQLTKNQGPRDTEYNISQRVKKGKEEYKTTGKTERNGIFTEDNQKVKRTFLSAYNAIKFILDDDFLTMEHQKQKLIFHTIVRFFKSGQECPLYSLFLIYIILFRGRVVSEYTILNIQSA
jgi:hypothetical protein